jgi:hypothetical protein
VPCDALLCCLSYLTVILNIVGWLAGWLVDRRTMWDYGPAKRLLLPLEGIDEHYGPDTFGSSSNSPTLLEVICANNTHDMMHISILSDFVVKKWLTSNQRVFLLEIAISVCKCFLLIGFVVTSKDLSSSSSLAFGVIYLFLAVLEISLEGLMCSRFGLGYLSDLSGTAKAMSCFSLLAAACLLAEILCVAAGSDVAAKVFLGLLSLVQTINTTCHLIGFERSGELIMIILEIMQEDVSTYLVIYSMGIVGESCGSQIHLVFLLCNVPASQSQHDICALIIVAINCFIAQDSRSLSTCCLPTSPCTASPPTTRPPAPSCS